MKVEPSKKVSAPRTTLSKHLERGLSTCIALALIFLVLVLVGFQIAKYRDGQTTLSTSAELAPDILMPAISFCPGFRPNVVEIKPWEMWEHAYGLWRENHTTFPNSKEEVEALWKDMTFEFHEILSNVSLSGVEGAPWHGSQEILEGNMPCVQISQRNTLVGKCFTLNVECPFPNTRDNYLVTYFNLSEISAINLIFHDHRFHLGLNDNYWPNPVNIELIRKEDIVDLMLTKRIVKRRSGDSLASTFQCLNDMALNGIQSILEDPEFCYYPAFESIVNFAPQGREELRYCLNHSSYDYSLNRVVRPLLFRLFRSDCVSHTANEERFDIFRRVLNRPKREGFSPVYIFFETFEVTVETEYVLLDFPSLVSAIGGFIGMLLGWSVLGLCQDGVKMFSVKMSGILN